MAGRAIDRRGVDSVMQGVDLFNTPYMSVWEGKILKFATVDDSTESSLNILQNNLEAMAQSGTDALYTIRFHKSPDKDGFITDKTPTVGSFNFKVSEALPALAGIGGVSEMYRSRNTTVDEVRINVLESRLSAIEDSLDSDDAPEDDNAVGAVGKLLDNPIVQQLAGILLQGFGVRGAAPATALAGIPDEQDAKINRALPILKRNAPNLGDVLMTLANVSESEPQKFAGLLKMVNML